MKTKTLILSIAVACIAAGTAYALGNNPRAGEVVVFNSGHTHDADGTHGAPQHSGGTDRYGCHNGSVPYHCH